MVFLNGYLVFMTVDVILSCKCGYFTNKITGGMAMILHCHRVTCTHVYMCMSYKVFLGRVKVKAKIFTNITTSEKVLGDA